MGPGRRISWFRADIDNPDGSGDKFARLRVRPLMGGIAYTIGEQPVLISFSIVAGPSFNDLDFHKDFVNAPPKVPRATSTRRTASQCGRASASRGRWRNASPSSASAATCSIGRRRLPRRGGTEYRNRWKADSILLSVGAVYSLF